MADDNDNQRGRSAAARKVVPGAGGADRTAAGDADVPVEDVVTGGGTDTAATPAPTRTRTRKRTPIWRTGRFWVAVILVEVALALVISFALERSATEVDLAGGDLPAFCAQIRTLREQDAAATAGNPSAEVTDASRFERERDAYLALVAVAPPDLVPDLELLADLDEQILVTVREIAERKAADPSYSGLTDLTAALDRAGVEGRVAAARVDLALANGCGFTAEDLAPTSTSAPTVAVPGSSPP